MQRTTGVVSITSPIELKRTTKIFTGVKVQKQKFVWDRSSGTGHYEEYEGTTCLQLNRMVKVNG